MLLTPENRKAYRKTMLKVQRNLEKLYEFDPPNFTAVREGSAKAIHDLYEFINDKLLEVDP